jgi:hypothetical protein
VQQASRLTVAYPAARHQNIGGALHVPKVMEQGIIAIRRPAISEEHR